MPLSIANTIDHAVLHPTQGDDDLIAACELCRSVGTASVCVKPPMVARAAELLAGSEVLVSTVIGFPHGATFPATKAAEAAEACRNGARELDMVCNYGWALEGNWAGVEADIRAVVEAGRQHAAIVKVIFETGLIPDDATKIQLCQISEQAGAKFVKTSTGFGYVKEEDGSLRATGATEHDVQLMKQHCSIGVKASGGIRDRTQAIRFLELGATRLGTSGTAQILSEGNAADAASGY